MFVHPLARRIGLALLIGLPLLAQAGCGRSEAVEGQPAARPPVVNESKPPPKQPAPANPTIPQEPSPFRFTEIAKEAGIDFVHFSGMTEARHFPSANGSGLAIFDADGDGRMDLYFASCTRLPLGSYESGPNRLYLNRGEGKFEDATEQSGLGFRGFNHGVIACDLDNDGDQDVVLCNYGPNKLYLNNGDGTFREVGGPAGISFEPALGSLEGGGTGDGPLVVDILGGHRWRVGGHEVETPLLKVKAGQKVVVRQADTDASHGIRFLENGAIQPIGGTETASTVLREVGAEASRLDVRALPIGAADEPKVVAEFEVVREPKEPLKFVCAGHPYTWSSGGAPIDYDNDGDLDLYLANYGEWLLERDDKFCGDFERKVRQYCSPKEVRTVKHFLYRNDGLRDGVPHFTDVTDSAGVGRADGHGFGVVSADVNGDNKIDLYVANDQNPNFLFLNNGDGTFKDFTEESAAAYDEKGRAQSGMGVDCADIDGDGRPELFVTNFKDEHNTLYQNLGNGFFYDQSTFMGLAADSMPWVAWGCGLIDFDNDGWPDCFVANGHVDDNYHLLGQNIPYAEPPLLHRNIVKGEGADASHRFQLATRGAGPYLETSHVARGVAFGDLDDDGDTEIVVNHKDGPPAVLRNDTPADGNHWVRFKLIGKKSNRDALGAQIELSLDNQTIHGQRKGGTSLESSHDPRVLLGVGKRTAVPKLTIRWPSGAVTTREDLAVDQTYEIEEPQD